MKKMAHYLRKCPQAKAYGPFNSGTDYSFPNFKIGE